MVEKTKKFFSEWWGGIVDTLTILGRMLMLSVVFLLPSIPVVFVVLYFDNYYLLFLFIPSFILGDLLWVILKEKVLKC